jgi:hypothetical protein
MLASSIVLLATVQGAASEDLEAQIRADFEDAVRERPSLSLAGRGEDAPRERVLACGSSQKCLLAIAREVGAEHALRAAIDRRSTPALYGLELFRVSDGSVIGRAVGEQKKGSWLRGEIRDRVHEILDAAGHTPRAQLRVSVVPPDAKVTFAPEAVPAGEATWLLVPGSYEISAERSGYVAARASLSAVPGRENEIQLQLAPVDPVGPSWIWIAIGAAGAAAAGVAIAAAVSGGPGCICIDVRGQGCPPCP